MLKHSLYLKSGLLNSNSRKAFTLVELIVVIVILAILATIAFLSFSSQSASARDSTRLADMSNIAKGLSVFNANAGTYPKPDSPVNITASGIQIGMQGYAGVNVLGMTKISNGGKDPLDSTHYTYSVNSNKSKMQLLGFLEDGSNIALSFNPYEGNPINGEPSSYSGRYVIIKGDKLGILLSSGNLVPVQVPGILIGTGIDVITSTGGSFSAYVTSKDILSGTGPILWELYGRYDTSVGTYPNCDMPNLKLPNGQIWSACNVGATNTFNGVNLIATCSTGCINDPYPTSHNMFGSYFQWGRNTDVTSSNSSTGPVLNETSTDFYTSSSDWLTDKNDNLWGGSGTTSVSGTYDSLGMPSAMRGPCANGYHIPTLAEWINAISSINPSLNVDLTWKNDTSVAKILRLPLAGTRTNSNANYYDQGNKGAYWSATSSGIYSNPVSITNTQLRFTNSYRALGISVRCLKN